MRLFSNGSNYIKYFKFKSDLRYKSYFKNNKNLYWLPISELNKKVDYRNYEMFYDQNNYSILNFKAGVGFLVAALTSKNEINIYKHLFNNAFEDKPITNKLSNLLFKQVYNISCGRDHSLIYGLILDNGNSNSRSLISFGNNTFGQCSDMINNAALNICDNIVRFPFSITQIQCGLDHSLVLTSNGKVYSCGLSTDGQTGLETYESVSQFTEISFGDHSINIKKISSCADTNLALTKDHRIFCWGNNEYGQVSVNMDEIQMNKPIELLFSGSNQIKDVLALGSFCLVITEANKVMVWGLCKNQGKPVLYGRPTEIEMLGIDGKIVDEEIIKLNGSVHYAVLQTVTGRTFIFGNYPSNKLNVQSNEIIFPKPVDDYCCGSDRLFFTM